SRLAGTRTSAPLGEARPGESLPRGLSLLPGWARVARGRPHGRSVDGADDAPVRGARDFRGDGTVRRPRGGCPALRGPTDPPGAALERKRRVLAVHGGAGPDAGSGCVHRRGALD